MNNDDVVLWWEERKVEEDVATVFENHKKSRIQHCERSELRLHFKWTKIDYFAQNSQFWRVSENMKLAVKHCYQIG